MNYFCKIKKQKAAIKATDWNHPALWLFDAKSVKFLAYDVENREYKENSRLILEKFSAPYEIMTVHLDIVFLFFNILLLYKKNCSAIIKMCGNCVNLYRKSVTDAMDTYKIHLAENLLTK